MKCSCGEECGIRIWCEECEKKAIKEMVNITLKLKNARKKFLKSTGGVIVKKEKIPEWAREVLLEEIEILDEFIKSLNEQDLKALKFILKESGDSKLDLSPELIVKKVDESG